MTLPVILFKKSKLQNLPEHSTAVKWEEAKDLKNGRLGAVLHEFKRGRGRIILMRDMA